MLFFSQNIEKALFSAFFWKKCAFFFQICHCILGLCPFKCTFRVNWLNIKVLNFGCGCFQMAGYMGQSLLQEGGAGHTCMPCWAGYFLLDYKKGDRPQPYSCPQVAVLLWLYYNLFLMLIFTQ